MLKKAPARSCLDQNQADKNKAGNRTTKIKQETHKLQNKIIGVTPAGSLGGGILSEFSY